MPVAQELKDTLVGVIRQVGSLCKNQYSPQSPCLSAECYAGETKRSCDGTSDGTCAENILKINGRCAGLSPLPPILVPDYKFICNAITAAIPAIPGLPDGPVIYVGCAYDVVEQHAAHKGLSLLLKLFNALCRPKCPRNPFRGPGPML